MDSIINELYYGNIRPVEQMGGLTPEAAAIMKRVHENEDKLEASLNEQEKELLHAIQADRLKVNSIIEEKRFREAFTLGARRGQCHKHTGPPKAGHNRKRGKKIGRKGKMGAGKEADRVCRKKGYSKGENYAIL